MTLEEAIRELDCSVLFHERESDKFARLGGTWYEGKAEAHKVCAEENGQLAAWLKELKAYRETYRTADRPQGEWIEQDNKHHIEKTYLCSNCENFEAWGESEKYNYCPNCGARMKGADDE